MSRDRVVEIRHDVHRDWIRERCSYRDDVRHGLRETFYADGLVHQRWHYAAGVEHGRYEELDKDGTPRLAGDYEDGRPHGRWTCRRSDGAIALEVEYDHGEVKESRIHMLDGASIAPGPIHDVRDMLCWQGLADAWHTTIAERSDAVTVEACIGNWPDGSKHHPLQWIRGRVAAGEPLPGGWSSDVLLERDDDLRLDWIDGLSLDHRDLGEEELARVVRRSHQLKRLALIEATVEPSLGALFQPPADWSSLRSLWIEEVYPDNPLPVLAHLALPALRELVLRGPLPDIRHENDATGAFVAQTVVDLARAPFWAQLRRLELCAVGSLDTMVALARHPMPALEELVLFDEDDERDVQEVLAAWYDATLRPRLKRSSRSGTPP